MDWDNISLLGKAKAAQKKNNKKQSETGNSFPTSHGHADIQTPPGKRCSSRLMVSWEYKGHHPRCAPLFPSFPQFYCWAWCLWGGTSLWAVWASCPGCDPPSSWCTPSLVAGRAAWEANKSLSLCKSCSAATKTSPLLSSKIQTKVSHNSLWRKLTLSQPKPWHLPKLRFVSCSVTLPCGCF